MSETIFERALLVEDEIHLAKSLRIALKKLGIATDHATTLKDARETMSSMRAPGLVVLDRKLPDGDGLELCEEWRSQGYAGAILVLTASGQVEDRVEGLNRGADDYLPKPFSWEELEARIRALARRTNVRGTSPGVLPGVSQAVQASSAPCPWTLDPERLRVAGPKGWKELTPLEFRLVSRLISANGSIVSRNDLLKDVWGFQLLPKTRTVDHFLGRLRKHFEENPEEPKHFLTVRGAGYRFEQ